MNAERLTAQLLAGPRPASPVAVAKWLLRSRPRTRASLETEARDVVRFLGLPVAG
jgi:hypothetical protein